MQGSRPSDNGLVKFALVLAAIVLARLLIGTVAIPLRFIPAANVIVSAFFVAVPILGMFAAAADLGRREGRDRVGLPLAMVAGGVIVQALFTWGVSRPGGLGDPFANGIGTAIAQTGLLVWCFGLGACLAQLLRDRNMVLPIALFLALFDIWLVFSPMGVVNQTVVQGNAEVLSKVAYSVAAPSEKSQAGFARPLAYVGPADFLFLAMFFVSLYRFRMRTRETLIAVVPVLIVYLLIVLLAGDRTVFGLRLGALPALVPIGATVLFVNRREFRLTGEERLVTALIGVLGLAFVYWSVFVYEPPPEPARKEAAAATKARSRVAIASSSAEVRSGCHWTPTRNG